MKHTKIAAYAAAAIALMFALLMVGGCGGGSKTTSITSPWNGTLAGVETIPADEEVDIPLDAYINVYWPHDGQAPPREFTVTLQKEQSPDKWGTVKTRLRSEYSDPINGDWYLEPVSTFSPFTWYRIIIRSTGETPVYAYFLTGDWYEDLSKSSSTRSTSAVKSKSYRPAGATEGTGEGSDTHTITVTK